ncbi:transcriptional regulator BetI [Aestuariivirga sp.]|uniref:transcriptional regulator BetI n=1 Tax=Aestuariivirga sp. TaxID=2650926 RepID=UPI00391C732E
MSRVKIRDFRRNELIDAAIASIAAHGLPDTTLMTIAEQAGVSPSLVNHYFDGKEELLEATLRRLTKELAFEIRRLTPANPTPAQRLEAIIDGCLQPEQLRPGAMFAWRAFWAQLPTHPQLASLQRTINRRFRSNIKVSLRSMVPPDEVDEVYLGLYALIDGFWMRQFIDPDSFSMDDARRICRRYLVTATASDRGEPAGV